MAERKRYITVKIPILKSEMRILGTAEELHDKTIKLDLTRKLRGKGLTVKFRIFNKEGDLFAVPNSMELASSYIRRVMRKRTSYVEDSFNARTSDLKVVIKPFLITRKKVSRVVRKNLRNTAREFIVEYVKEKDYLTICSDVLSGDLQKALLPKLKKVYPLSFCDLRVFETGEIANLDLDKIFMIDDVQEDDSDSEGIDFKDDDELTEEVEETLEKDLEEADTPENEEEAEEEIEEEAAREAVEEAVEDSDPQKRDDSAEPEDKE